MKRLFLLLALAALACSIPARLPTIPAKPLPTVVKVSTKQPTELLATVTATSLHVRAQPMGLILGYLYKADIVTLTGKCQTKWAQIRWQGQAAWVNAKFLSNNDCQTKEGE